MLIQYDAMLDAIHLANAFTLLVMMAWWHKSSPEGDDVISAAAQELIEGVSDADRVNKIEDATTINLRDQVSIEQVEEWAKEREYHKHKNRN